MRADYRQTFLLSLTHELRFSLLRPPIYVTPKEDGISATASIACAAYRLIFGSIRCELLNMLVDDDYFRRLMPLQD